ncbi:MAG: glycosyltransferase family 4 protein [Vicinamibacterales bacterium]
MKRLAVFDYNVTAMSPIGSCVRAEVGGICDEFDVTVFAHHFENPRPDRIRWVRVPCPSWPLIFREWVFALLSPLLLRREVLLRGPFDIIQATEGQFTGCDICYAQFCHRAYMRNQWRIAGDKGLRRIARWIGHTRNAHRERLSFSHAKAVVVPSKGLEQEVLRVYPFLSGKIVNIPNAVDVERFARPADCDVAELRRGWSFTPDHAVIVFVALGDFGRKGLRVLLEGASMVASERLRILVVGGSEGEIGEYEQIADSLGIKKKVYFSGLTKDIRPFLWASDVFAFPTAYETFSLVAFQAAAAGLPLMVTPVYGIEDLIRHGVNGWSIERTPESIKHAVEAALGDRARLVAMGKVAQLEAQKYDVAGFPDSWMRLLRQMHSER